MADYRRGAEIYHRRIEVAGDEVKRPSLNKDAKLNFLHTSSCFQNESEQAKADLYECYCEFFLIFNVIVS